MPLRTVSVPTHLEPLFAEAERVVEAYFESATPQDGSGPQGPMGSGYILVRGASLSVAFFRVVRDLFGEGNHDKADTFARNLLFDLAHAVGKADAQALHDRMGLTEPMARLSAGPVHFEKTGWAHVEIHPDSNPVASDAFFLLYDHHRSFEAEAWLAEETPSDHPVCIMNAGYSAGWCEQSFGVSLVATELSCRGAGDDRCCFAMGVPGRLSEHLRDHLPEVEPHWIPHLFGRRQLEEDLRRSHEELEQRLLLHTAELREANRAVVREIDERRAAEDQLRLAQKLDAVGRLAGGVAHDFNNLLTVVLGNAELLSKRVQDADSRELVDHIRTAAERAADLTQQLLAVGRRQPRSPRALDLNEVVRGMARMFERVLRADISVEVNLTPEGAPVTADAGQVEQILLNLVVNARDAMPRGGILRLSTRRLPPGDDDTGPGQVVLRVSDDGRGMDTSTQARIFEPFFTTKPPGQGTGLGLAMVYGIVEQTGGHITVESAVGAGSTFTVRLPLSLETPTPEARAPWRRQSGGGAHILVVEDEPALLELARLALTHYGYTVHVASDAEEAWQQWRQHPVQLLFTDVLMPGESGVELALRCRTEQPDLPVLFASGYAEEEVLDGAPNDSVDFLPKPYRPSSLIARVTSLIEE